MISELQAERDRLDNAILALERLSEGKQQSRGRPPKWLKDRSLGQPDSAPEEELANNGEISRGQKS